MTKKLFIFLSMFLLLTSTLFSQVTTSSLTGKVSTEEVEDPVIGSFVVATHTPSGTEYAAITNSEGRFNINGMRVGGPYKVKISYVGYETVIITDINIALGETENINVKLNESSLMLKEIVVSAKKTVTKNGTITNIGSDQISKIPTISRSINDFTKLSPFASSGSSFAGRDGRYNTITLDGASLNNNFGLSSKNLPGGDAQPISVDAIEQISVNVSPYDVKYSNFTGASINVVTKSGTNKVTGSVYTLQRPKSFTGNMVDTFEVANANTRSSQTYGFTVGAPIVKNKMFVFINGEYEKETFPGIEWRASSDGVSNIDTKTSRTSLTDLQTMKDFLVNNYSYDPGYYQNFGNFASSNMKLMTRFDWNINDKNKFMFRFNTVDSRNDQEVNATSAPNPRGGNRIGIESMAFSNSNYKFHNVVTSLTGELNTRFNDVVSNKFLATYTHIQDTRQELGNPFPFVDIYKDGKQYMSFGTELFTPNNNVINNVASVINNVSISANNHFITVGGSFEHQYFVNSYLRYPYGYYRYASMSDFMNNSKPLAYGLTYGYGGNDAPGAELNFGMTGLYVQDEWYVNPDFRLTYGIRADLPLYFDKMNGNEEIQKLSFADERSIDVSKWPTPKVLYSPRIGFKWNINGDNSIVINGGTGVFTGLLPFVWFTNQPTNAGVIQNTVELTGSSIPSDLGFMPNYKDVITKYPNSFPSSKVSVPGSIAFVDPEFKLPQVWRTSLGIDLELPYGFDLSLNGMFTRDIYNVVQINVNEKTPTLNYTGSGADNRPYYVNNNSSRRYITSVSNAMMLTNGEEKGYQYSLNTTLSKRLENGFSGMISYTYTNAKDLTSNPGSAAASAWSSNVAVGSLNDPGLSYSAFAVPHRIISNISYDLNLFDVSKTTFSLFYSGSHTGRVSYTGSNDLNYDGNTADLIYIPATKDELKFVKNGSYTPEQQQDDFWNYINNNDYLSKNKGQYAERYGDLRPWLNRFDFKISENFNVKVGQQKIGVELSLNTINIGNMLNSSWGTYKTMGVMSYDNARLVKLSSISPEGVPSYQINASNSDDFKSNTTWKHNISTSSTWGMIAGLKLTF